MSAAPQGPRGSEGDFLTVEETEALLLSALRRGHHTEKQLQKIVAWADSARFNSALLRLILGGGADVSVEAGEVRFWPREGA